jgi:hypothetical protein
MLIHRETQGFKEASGTVADENIAFEYLYYPETQKVVKRTLESYAKTLQSDEANNQIVVGSEEVEEKNLPQIVREKLINLLRTRSAS